MGRLGIRALTRRGAAALVVLAVSCGASADPAGAPSTSEPDVAANRTTEVRGAQATRTPIAVTPYERQAFLEVALEPAVVRAPRRPVGLERWMRDPTVRINGSPSAEDLRRVDDAIVWWSYITGRRISLTTAPADIELHFAPRAAFANVLEVDNVDATAVGLTRVAFDPNQRGAITSAVMVIASDDDQVARNRTIAHELGHAIGLQHSTCASSLMDGSSDSERSVRWTPSALDVRMGTLLYDTRFAAGMSQRAVETALEPTAANGATCGPVDLELVRSAGTSRQYFCARGPQRVRPCTSVTTVEPALPIVNPDAWTDGASLTLRAPR